MTKDPNVITWPYAVMLLDFLHKRGPIRAGKLYELHTNFTLLTTLAREMAAPPIELVKIEIVKGKPPTHLYSLTEKGHKIAVELEAIRVEIYGVDQKDQPTQPYS